MAEAQRVEIGFEGGQVVSVRLSDDELKDLRKQLEKGGWYDVRTEDGILAVYLGKVAFLRIDSGEHRVGFSLDIGLMRARTVLGLAGAATLGAALWWRENPSACPYGQRFWVEAPHPIVTRDRLRSVLRAGSRASGCSRSAPAPATTPSTWPTGSGPRAGSRSSTSSRSSSTT